MKVHHLNFYIAKMVHKAMDNKDLLFHLELEVVML